MEDIKPLLDLIEKRFDLRIEGSSEHLQELHDHYSEKKIFLRNSLGESQSLLNTEYAKAVMISEATRMILKEILPKPKKKRKK